MARNMPKIKHQKENKTNNTVKPVLEDKGRETHTREYSE